MKIKEIKKLSNPYYPLSSKLSNREFVGRESYLTKLRVVLDDYSKTLKLKNIIISGVKAVGKSTILNKYKEILLENSFYVHEVELSRDPSNKIDEYDFYKEFIDQTFLETAHVEATFFDPRQAEIWFSLTSDKFDHDSSYLERKLLFATLYSNQMQGKRETINYTTIERDFNNIISEILRPENEYKGVAIIIDEFQELSKNVFLLDQLRKLSENLTGLIIVAAGLPTFLGNPIFEKFIRNSEPLLLNNFEEKESLDLIFKPIEIKGNISRHEAEKLIDFSTIKNLLDKTKGNPLHLKLILANLFDYFSKDETMEKMSLNRNVMENVMQYYCHNSENSLIIRNSLSSASREQLDIFAKLYKYEGLTLRQIILIELAFDSIQTSRENEIKDKIVADISQIYELCLFKIENFISDLEELYNLSSNQLSQISYKFIGDSIDKLYASYYYEDLTKKELNIDEKTSFEILLANKLGVELSNSIFSKRIPSFKADNHFDNIMSQKTELQKDGKVFINSLEKLKKVDPDKEITTEIKELINNLCYNYGLMIPAYLLSSFEFKGYYVLMTHVTIRGKDKIIYNYYPVEGDIEQIMEFKEQITDYSSVINASLLEYNINVNWMYLYWFSKEPWILIHHVDVDEGQSSLYKYVRERDFEKAVKVAEKIFEMNVKMKDKSILANTTYYNNYGFCLLQMNDLDEAKNIFEELQESFVVSKINLAFIYYEENNLEEAWKILTSLNRKKLPDRFDAAYLNLFIKHPNLNISHKLVEDIRIENHIKWNLALLSVQRQNDKSVINSFLKDAKSSQKEVPIEYRVKAWINYYQHNYKSSLVLIGKAMKLVGSNEKLLQSYSNDYSIFSTALSLDEQTSVL